MCVCGWVGGWLGGCVCVCLLFVFVCVHFISKFACLKYLLCDMLSNASVSTRVRVVGGCVQHTQSNFTCSVLQAVTNTLVLPTRQSLLITASLDKTIRVWNLCTYEEVYK